LIGGVLRFFQQRRIERAELLTLKSFTTAIAATSRIAASTAAQ